MMYSANACDIVSQQKIAIAVIGASPAKAKREWPPYIREVAF